MKKIKIAVLAFNLMIFSVGCTSPSPKVVQDLPTEEPTTEAAVGDAAIDPLAGIVLVGADEAKKIDLTTIKTIQLFDIDGIAVEKTFSAEEITAIGQAYNDSMIDDISYIAMISGYTMDITLNTDQVIHMTSYGDDTRIVATTNDTTYHLICPEIGKILLTTL